VRRAANKVRIEAQLTDAVTGFNLWSEDYDEDLSDVFQIQSQVAEKVAGALQIKLLSTDRARIERRPTENQDAYDLYLLGMHYNEAQTLEGATKAIDCFKRAIAKDPNFSRAYAGLSENYEFSSGLGGPPRELFPKPREAAEKALALDGTDAFAHTDLAFALWAFDWDWPGAEREFKRALELDPNLDLAHMEYGQFLVSLGRYQEGISEVERARELSPLTVVWVKYLGDMYYRSRRYDEALHYCDRAIEMNPNFAPAYWSRTFPELEKGNLASAVRDAERANDPALLGFVYGLVGKRDDANKILRQLLDQSKKNYVNPVAIESIYFGLDDKDNGFEWMKKAYEGREIAMTSLRDPVWDRVRSDSRFQAIFKKVGLPPLEDTEK